jgi:hypothetical protein
MSRVTRTARIEFTADSLWLSEDSGPEAGWRIIESELGKLSLRNEGQIISNVFFLEWEDTGDDTDATDEIESDIQMPLADTGDW